MICPFCGSPHVDADYVDNGVGMQQCGPYGCEECHSYQMGNPNGTEADTATEEERRLGWWRGDEVAEAIERHAKARGKTTP